MSTAGPPLPPVSSFFLMCPSPCSLPFLWFLSPSLSLTSLSLSQELFPSKSAPPQPCSFPECALPSSSHARRHTFVPDGSAKPPVRDLVSLLILRRPASRAMDARASFQCRLVPAPPPSSTSSAFPRSVQASPGPFPRWIQGFPLAPICWLTSSASRVGRRPAAPRPSPVELQPSPSSSSPRSSSSTAPSPSAPRPVARLLPSPWDLVALAFATAAPSSPASPAYPATSSPPRPGLTPGPAIADANPPVSVDPVAGTSPAPASPDRKSVV